MPTYRFPHPKGGLYAPLSLLPFSPIFKAKLPNANPLTPPAVPPIGGVQPPVG